MIERSVELHSQQLRRSGGGAVVPPIRRVDPGSHRRADLVMPFRAVSQRPASGIAEFSVDSDDDWHTLD